MDLELPISVHAHAREYSAENTRSEVQDVVINLQSQDLVDKDHAVRQIGIWMYQKSSILQDFIAQGGLEHLMEAMKDTSDTDTPSSSTSSEGVSPYVELIHDFAKEGKQVQDSLAIFGGVPLLLQFLADSLHIHADGIQEDQAYVIAEALAGLALITLGSREGRKEVIYHGGILLLAALLSRKHAMSVRRHAASALIGLASESSEQSLTILEANGLSLLLELLEHIASDNEEAQHAALNAAVSLRRLCDSQNNADMFCKVKGLSIVATRLQTNGPDDRVPLRLPQPLGPSTVRAECKHLLGDIYMTSSTIYQEMMVEVLAQRGLTLDHISTTPTAGQGVRPRSSLDRGHESLSCKTSGSKGHKQKSSLKKAKPEGKEKKIQPEQGIYEVKQEARSAASRPKALQGWFGRMLICGQPISTK